MRGWYRDCLGRGAGSESFRPEAAPPSTSCIFTELGTMFTFYHFFRSSVLKTHQNRRLLPAYLGRVELRLDFYPAWTCGTRTIRSAAKQSAHGGAPSRLSYANHKRMLAIARVAKLQCSSPLLTHSDRPLIQSVLTEKQLIHAYATRLHSRTDTMALEFISRFRVGTAAR